MVRGTLIAVLSCCMLAFWVGFGNALSCPPPGTACEHEPTCCESGVLVKQGDVCAQCDRCAKSEFESCNGSWGIDGDCALGYRCLLQGRRFRIDPLMASGVCLREEIAEAWESHAKKNTEPWKPKIKLLPEIKKSRTKQVPKCGEEKKKEGYYLLETKDKKA